MKVDHDDEMRTEYDFSSAVRGKYADRWTPRERDAFLRESSLASVRQLHGYALDEVRQLETSLFVLLVLAGSGESGERLHALPPLVEGVRSASLLQSELVDRLTRLAREHEWLVRPRDEPYTGPGSLTHVLDRLESHYACARDLKEQVQQRLERHLAEEGLSRQEIERRTEEAAKLWLAR